MVKTYFKTTFRNIWRNPVNSSLNMAGLAVGIACWGLIFLWVGEEQGFDHINLKIDRLYKVNVNGSFGDHVYTMGSTPRAMAALLKKEVPGIVNAARVSDELQPSFFSYDNKSLYASGLYADSSLFSMFTLDFVKGNSRDAFRQLYSLVITEKTCRKLFGDEKDIIGKTVRADNSHDYTVTGVLKDLPENSTLQFEWLAPYEVSFAKFQSRWGSESNETKWDSYGPFTYVELGGQTNTSSINRQLKDYITRKDPSQKKECFLFSMRDWRLYNEFQNGKPTGSGRISQVHMLSAIAWVIMLIACINFMNLATANSQSRMKLVGVLKVLGAGKRRLVIQFIGEAFFLSIIASLVAVAIIALGLPAFNSFMQTQLSLRLTQPVHSLKLLVIMIICGLVAGSYPAFYLSSFKPATVLKDLKTATGSAALIRKGLVVFQFTVSVVFIICTIICYRQIQHVKERELGFNKDRLVEIDMQHNATTIFPLIRQDLLHTGFVENAALSDHVTLYGGNTDNRFTWQGKPADNEVSVTLRYVSPEFISTSGMQIVAGRDFAPGAASGTTDIIITQTMEKMMGQGSAIGKIIRSARGNEGNVFTNLNVVGVVKDYVYGNIYGSPGPVIFFCNPVENANMLYVRIKSGKELKQAITSIDAVIKKNNPPYPTVFKFVDDQFQEMFFNETLVSKASKVFALLAIIISCLGLFGLAAYTTEQRSKEIAIRKVLGGSIVGLAGLLSKEFLKLVGVACIIAFSLAGWIMTYWLQEYEYRINLSPGIFILAGAMAMFVALVTVSFQTIRAALSNPIKSLRTV